MIHNTEFKLKQQNIVNKLWPWISEPWVGLLVINVTIVIYSFIIILLAIF